MLRFLLTAYRRFVLGDILVVAFGQIISILVYDLGVVEIRAPLRENLSIAFTLGLFAIAPFVLGLDARRRYGNALPGNRTLAGWNLGLGLNVVVGLVSVLLGFFQAWLRYGVLKASEATAGPFFLGLLVGFVIIIWLGGVAGWIGSTIGWVSRKR